MDWCRTAVATEETGTWLPQVARNAVSLGRKRKGKIRKEIIELELHLQIPLRCHLNKAPFNTRVFDLWITQIIPDNCTTLVFINLMKV